MLLLIISLSILLTPGHLIDSSKDPHAIYVSVLEIVEVAESQGGEIRIKVFANDLEDAIFNRSHKRIDLINGSCDVNNDLVSNYFVNHLAISIDSKPIVYKFSSCEVNDISIWFTYSFTAPSSWTNVEVKANYLMELFPTQTNVVSINYQGQKKMFRLIKGDETELLSF